MWKIALASVLTSGLLVLGTKDNNICDGRFKIDKVDKCENPEQYPFDFTIQKRKINRTHDGFNITADLKEEITPALGIRLESYIKCDGGYKASDLVGSSSACQLIEEYCEEMFVQILTMAGVEPPSCPIPKGPFIVQDMVIDYNTLPKQYKCGESKTNLFLLQGGLEIACLTVFYTFSETEENDED